MTPVQPLGVPGDLASYEVGHRDGENSAHADWHHALTELLPDGLDVGDGPWETATRIAAALAGGDVR